MTDDPLGSGPENPGTEGLWRWSAWGLILLLLVVGFLLWEPFPPGIWHDDGVYVMLGRSLAQGEGLRYLGVVGSPLAPKFPPLFPLLLALGWLLSPSFPDNVPILASMNLLLTAGAGGLFVAYLNRALRVKAPLALLVGVLAWMAPQMWRVSLVPLSEPLFLLTLLGALWAGARMERERGWGPVLLFLLAGGATSYTRTLGVAVLLAGAMAVLSRGRVRAAGGILLGSVALLLPWLAWTRWASTSIPDTLQDTLGPYGPWLLGQATAYPGEFLSFLVGNASHLLARVLSLHLPGVTGGTVWWGLLLVPFILLGLTDMWKASRTLPLTLALCLGILLVWPFQHIRLLVPFHPLLISATILGFRRGVATLAGESGIGGKARWARLPVAGLGLIWLAVMIPVSLVRLASGWPGEPYRIRSEALVTAVRAVEAHTPPDAVIGAPELWSGVHLFTGRSVVPSARFRPLVPDTPPGGTIDEQVELWIAQGVTHLVVEHGGDVHGDALDRIDALCPSGTVQLLDNQPGQFLVGLNWDSACQQRVLAAGSAEGATGEAGRPQ